MKSRVEFSAVVRAAAGQARDCTAYAADARKFLATIWAPINEARRVSSRWERKIVTALLIDDSEVVTSLSPLLAMGENPAPPRTKLSENVGQFMAQSTIDFGRMLKQPRVQ